MIASTWSTVETIASAPRVDGAAGPAASAKTRASSSPSRRRSSSARITSTYSGGVRTTGRDGGDGASVMSRLRDADAAATRCAGGALVARARSVSAGDRLEHALRDVEVRVDVLHVVVLLERVDQAQEL